MAHTQVNEVCLICGKIIEPDSNCYYISTVKVVKYGIRAGNVLYNPGKIAPVKEGKLRIQFLNGFKGLLHKSCFD